MKIWVAVFAFVVLGMLAFGVIDAERRICSIELSLGIEAPGFLTKCEASAP